MDMTEVQSRTQLSAPALANRWALWGIGAGVLGILANLVTDPIVSLTTAQKQQGSAVLSHVHRAMMGDPGVLVATGDQFENLALACGQARERSGRAKHPAADRIQDASGGASPMHCLAAGDRDHGPRDVIGASLLEQVPACPGAKGGEERVIVLAHREHEHGDGRMPGHDPPRRHRRDSIRPSGNSMGSSVTCSQ